MQTDNDKQEKTEPLQTNVQRKAEPIEARVQTGKVGFYPLNSLALSALYHGQTDFIIGERHDKDAEKLRTQEEFNVSNHQINLKKKVFTGVCDSFYRGRLPELLIVTSNMAQIPEFIEEFMDFVEKLSALGFLTSKDMDEIAVLDRYVPEVIIASYGLVFDVILEKFNFALGNLTAILPRQKERLLQKLSRALFTYPTEGYDIKLLPLTLFPKPVKLNLAGFKSMYTIRTMQLLESNNIPYQFNPNGEIGILEHELNLAYKHIIHRLIPLLKLKGAKLTVTEEHMKELFDNLGQKSGILPGLTVALGKTSFTFKPGLLDLTTVDLAILYRIKIIAIAKDSNDMAVALDELSEQVKSALDESLSTNKR